jgi:hypothetical protein
LIKESISRAKKEDPLFQKPLAQDPSEKLIEVHVAALKWHMQSRTFEMTAHKLRKLQEQSVSLLELLKTNLPEKVERPLRGNSRKRTVFCTRCASSSCSDGQRISVPRGQSTVTLTSAKKWQPAPTIRTYFYAS